jgi:hypothetical protein
MAESPLPLDDVVTPDLDEWDHRLGGWDTWIAPDETFRVHVEMVDLEVPADDAVLTGFEVRLDDLREGRPYPVVLRETVRNAHLAVAIAELVAAEPARYADEWNDGLAPRPEDVGRIQEGEHGE